MNWLAYPFLRYAAVLAIGILMARVFPEVPTISVLWLWAASGLLFTFGHFRSGDGSIAGLSFLFLTGFLVCFLKDGFRSPDHLSRRSFQGYRAVLVSGPEKKATFSKATVRVMFVRTATGWEKATGNVVCYIEGADSLRYGDELLMAGSPEPIPPPGNPGEFDYRHFLRLSGTGHQHYLPAGQYVRLRHMPDSWLTASALAVNAQAAALLDRAFVSRQDASIAAAMLLGVKEDIDPELLQAYSSAGAIHALSVSGMHVGILFLVLGRLLGFLKKRSRGGRWLFASLVLGAVWGYAILTGLSAPVVRSALMLSLFVCADTFRLDSHPLNTLAFSAFLQLLLQPFALFQMSFQLSYLSVAGLVLLFPRLRWAWRPAHPLMLEIWEMSCGAVSAQLLTFPLAVCYFHQFPTWFLLANPFVLSLSSGGLVLGLAYLGLSWVPVLGRFLQYHLQVFFGSLNTIILATDQLPGARWDKLFLGPGEWLCLTAVVAFVLLTVFRRNRLWLWPGLGLAVLLVVQKATAVRRHRSQQLLIVHSLRKYAAISVVCGRTHFIRADHIPDKRVLNRSVYCLQPVFGILRTDSLPVSPLFSSGQSGVVQGRTLVWLFRYSGEKIRFRTPVDYLIFSHNARRYPDPFLLNSPVTWYIFDASNSEATVNRWKKALRPLGKKCVDIRQEGAFVSRW